MDKERLVEIIGSVKTAFDMVLSELEGCAGFDREQTERDRDDAVRLLMNQAEQKFFVDENGKWIPLPIITRCKDCKNQDDLRLEIGGKFVCRKGHGWNPDDFYCGDGEPKDGDGE